MIALYIQMAAVALFAAAIFIVRAQMKHAAARREREWQQAGEELR